MIKAWPKETVKEQKEEAKKCIQDEAPAFEHSPRPLSLPTVHGPFLQGQQPLSQLPAAPTHQLQPHCWKLNYSVYGT